MSTHNICFHGKLMKIILQLPSNTLLILICSSALSEKQLKWEFDDNLGIISHTCISKKKTFCGYTLESHCQTHVVGTH